MKRVILLCDLVVSLVMPWQTSMSAAEKVSHPVQAPIAEDYVIGVEDVLFVAVWKNPDLSRGFGYLTICSFHSFNIRSFIAVCAIQKILQGSLLKFLCF